jgi:hypothetical protein
MAGSRRMFPTTPGTSTIHGGRLRARDDGASFDDLPAAIQPLSPADRPEPLTDRSLTPVTPHFLSDSPGLGFVSGFILLDHHGRLGLSASARPLYLRAFEFRPALEMP